MSDKRCAKGAEYRRRAHQARTVAYLISIKLIKHQLLEGARIYDAFAERAEAQERDSRRVEWERIYTQKS